MTIPTFLNFGRDYAGARDGFVYSYAIQPTYGPGRSHSATAYQSGFDIHRPGATHLVGVPGALRIPFDWQEPREGVLTYLMRQIHGFLIRPAMWRMMEIHKMHRIGGFPNCSTLARRSRISAKRRGVSRL